MSLQVDVVSDIVCPWCYIGKRRLRGAMTRLQGPSVVRWHPMQLYPDVPAKGADFEPFLEQRFGDLAGVHSVMRQLTATGTDLGIAFDFENIKRVPNTLDAHRLVYSAGTQQQDQLIESLFSGFFEHGLDISDRDVLVSLAEQSGIEGGLAHKALNDERTREAVLSEQERMKQLGLSGVPSFLLNRRLSVSGAQDTDTLIQAFDYALFGLPQKDSPPPVLH